VLPDSRNVTNIYHLNGLLATNVGARAYPVSYKYDSQGRLLRMTTWTNYPSSGAANTDWKYSGQRGFLTNKFFIGNFSKAEYGYTNSGRLLWRKWTRNVTTSYGYNAAGDLATVVYSDSTGNVTNTYDRPGRLKTVNQGTNVTTLLYNDAGPAVSETFNGLTLTNEFDALLRRTNVALLTNSTLAFRHSYVFDSASRLSSVEFGTNRAGYTYLTNSPLVETMGFTNGSTLRLTVSNRYDNLNRLTTKDNRTNSASLVRFNYGYNAANQRTGNTNVDNSYWVYQYDNLGQVISGKRYWSDGTPVAGQQFEYKFDDIGNRRYARSGGDTNGSNLRQEDYVVVTGNQYTSRTVPGYLDVLGSAATNANVAVNERLAERQGEYFRGEAAFNNTSASLWASVTNVALLPGVTLDVATNSVSSLFIPKTPQNFIHDWDGNLTNDGRFAYYWDGENRLSRMESLTNSTPSNSWRKVLFSYDHQGRRVSKVVSNWTAGTWSNALTLRFIYDGWNLLGEFNNTTSASPLLLRSYAWGTDLTGTLQGAGSVGGLVAMTDHSGVIGGLASTHFPCYDGNGNVVALVNAADGSVTAQYEYGPFGTLLRTTGPLAFLNPLRFSTKYHDDEVGVVYYGYRYYSPALGRWANRDPIDENGGLSLYAFLKNDGLSATDKLGHECNRSGRHSTVAVTVPHADFAFLNASIGEIGSSATAQTLVDAVKKKKGNCDCVSRLVIAAHGAPGYFEITGGGTNTSDTLQANVIGSPNAFPIFQALDRTVCFCRPCHIYFLICQLGNGNGLNFLHAVAKSTGCTVVAPVGFVDVQDLNLPLGNVVYKSYVNGTGPIIPRDQAWTVVSPAGNVGRPFGN
jgi:RHS repeat-associated protein